MSTRADLPLLGMHCAGCASSIEKALAGTAGVEEASVNFGTARATVRFDPAVVGLQSLREVVRRAGFDALISEDGDRPKNVGDAELAAREAEYSRQRRSFLIALILSAPVAFLAMAGHVVPALDSLLDFAARPWIEMAL